MQLLPSALALLCLAILEPAAAQHSSDDSSSTTHHSSHKSTKTTHHAIASVSGSLSNGHIQTLSSFSVPALTGTRYSYASPSSQVTLDASSFSFSSFPASTSGSISGSASGSASASGGSHNGSATASNSRSGSSSSSSSRTTKHSTTHLVGSTRSPNATASSTSSSAKPTNTTPCNGHPEFCNRQYSNITQVCAHNSAFDVANNAGSNQDLDVTTQLEDGIRMIQGETHWYNGSIMNCHSTCELLNAGPWVDELTTVATWLRRNPYDVVTWLVVNSDFINVEHYARAIQQAGIEDLLYIPDYIPQHRDQWPTLSDMILSGKRLVMFMDYNANQTAVPYILDEFTHMWETPFSPTNPNFPCTQQRPPNLNQTKARDQFMYLANHNLNTAINLNALLGTSGGGENQLLIPNTAQINRTNGLQNSFGQMGKMSEECTAQWGRPPNFLLVDYYNWGKPYQGSVFEVAAKANGVHYNKNSCCGTEASSSAASPTATEPSSPLVALTAALGFAVLLAW